MGDGGGGGGGGQGVRCSTQLWEDRSARKVDMLSMVRLPSKYTLRFLTL